MAICSLSDLQPGSPAVLTIGMFDGMHRGHQALIDQVKVRAAALGAQSIVLTFYPHPRAVLSPGAPLHELSGTEERIGSIAARGVDVVATLEFTRRVAQLSAEAFLDLMQEHINLREVWGGPTLALGNQRSGTIARLREMAGRRGFTLGILPAVIVAGAPVSSSRVRAALAAGRVEEAALLLGRWARLDGAVVMGFQRGRRLGFPTANVALAGPHLLPANGIYAVFAEVDGVRRPAVANIGVRPTFDGISGQSARQMEVHILDFSGDLYGRRLGVHLVRRLRDEMRFASVDALVEQIGKDVAHARAVLADSQGTEPQMRAGEREDWSPSA